MEQARWHGIDGVHDRTRAPYRGLRVRHELADAARGYDWPRVLRILGDHPDCVNASRPGGRSRYAPLHQAAHGGAPAWVANRLIYMGAWRTLRTRDGERPVDIARRRGRPSLIPILTPVYRRRRLPAHDLASLQRHFHAVIRQHRPGRAPSLRLPELEPLLELGGKKVCFEVPGMYGGFRYRLVDDDAVPRLLVEAYCRVVEGSPIRYEVTPSGWRRLGPADEPGSDRPPHGRRPAGGARRARRPASTSARTASDAVSAYDALPSRAHRAGISCRKTHLAFVMDMNDIPWSWETPEAVLEERLRNTDPAAYREFVRDREEA